MTQESANQAASVHDVFVSYASQDVAVANSIVENLEQHGLKCWIAPRDVKPGAQYADAIVRAINEAKDRLAREVMFRDGVYPSMGPAGNASLRFTPRLVTSRVNLRSLRMVLPTFARTAMPE